jgi:hypothetical protein
MGSELVDCSDDGWRRFGSEENHAGGCVG